MVSVINVQTNHVVFMLTLKTKVCIARIGAQSRASQAPVEELVLGL